MHCLAVNVLYLGHNVARQGIYTQKTEDCNPLQKVRKKNRKEYKQEKKREISWLKARRDL
jgi:hypothetical protein